MAETEEISGDETVVPEAAEPQEVSRYPELDEIQRAVERQIRDNQRFLERILDDDFPEGEDEGDGRDEGEEDFEEL